ncbi:MAG: tripartite tricarboxylate transporter substrate binding protein [Propionivibrio sp.]
MMKKMTLCLSAALTLLTIAGLGTAQAADFPNKPIEIIVPSSAGGGTDMLSRALANTAKDIFGQPVVVVNKPGGSGVIGFTAGQTAKPDGYTVTMFFAEIVIVPHLGLAQTDHKLFEPIMRVNMDPAAITVQADAPWNTLQEFIDYAKANPGKLRVANSGPGSIWQLAAARMEDKFGLKFNQVPYSGAAPGVTALLSGAVDAAAFSPAEVGSQVMAGKLKMLGIMSDKREKAYPDVPTFKEQGVDIVIGTWRGLGVPKGTPADVKKILHDGFKKAMEDPVFVDQMEKAGLGLGYMDAADFAKFQDEEFAVYKGLVDKLGLKAK